MKIKFLPIIGILLTSMPLQSFEQETLPAVTVLARNYQYLRSADSREAAQPVRLLERKAATYDVKSSDYYEDDYANYFISFYLPEGYVLATYDSTGKIIRTAERFRNVALPLAVRDAVAERFPKWAITNDIYKVEYKDQEGAEKQYKLVLQNGTKRVRVKINEKGEFKE